MPQVLIVDDDEATRFSVRSALELDGDEGQRHYVVAEAATGSDALDRLHAGTAPTVVLFDLYMTGMDGGQFFQLAVADAALATRCTFVCMTASASRLPADLIALLEASGVPIVSKPFDIDDLLAVVAAAADKLPAQ